MSALGYMTVREPLLAWRVWRVLPFQRLDGTRTLRLCAVGTLGAPKLWEPRLATTAVCSGYGSQHEAPWPDHECGIWALKRAEDARRRMVGFMQTQGDEPVGWAVGQVSLWGRVIEHEHGYRAQHAYPYSVSVETADDQTVQVLRDEYAVDVDWAGSDLYAKALAKRESRAERAAPPPLDRKAILQRLEAIEKMLGELDQALPPEPPSRPSARLLWSVIRDATPEQVAAAVRDAQAKSPDGVASSREVCVAFALVNGFSESEGYRYEMGQALKLFSIGGHVLQIKQRGASSARWCLPGTVLPDGCSVRENPHEREDAEALEALRATLKATGAKSAGTCEVLGHLGRPDASKREKTMFAHALGRQVYRGNVSHQGYPSSEARRWALTEQGTHSV